MFWERLLFGLFVLSFTALAPSANLSAQSKPAAKPAGKPAAKPLGKPAAKLSPKPAAKWVHSESILGSVDMADRKRESLIVSPDGRHMAYIERVESNQVVVIDGKRSREYPRVTEDSLSFSPDSQHHAYGVWDGESKVILDGEALPSFGEIKLAPKFSPDSQHLAYGVSQKGKCFVVLDGKPGKPFEFVNEYSLAFSPDSQHLAYSVVSRADYQNSEQCVVLDGVEGPPLRQIRTRPMFSPDSRRIIYVAGGSGNETLVVDGKVGEWYRVIAGRAISPDSQHVAYIAVTKDYKQWVVSDGKPGEAYERIVTVPYFSPDSSHMVYLAMNAGKVFAVLDGVAGKPYDEVWNYTLKFSPDGTRLGYIAKQNGKWVAVFDGQEGAPHDYGSPTLDPNNDSIINGWKNERERGFLAFSPDSKRVAYLAQYGRVLRLKLRNGNQVMDIVAGVADVSVVADGREGVKYGDIASDSIGFSPDSRHLVYAAQKGPKWFVVADEIPGPEFDSILVPEDGSIVFDAPDTFHYLAVKNGVLSVVTAKWSEPPPAPGAKPR